MTKTWLLALIALAYVAGSIPFGLLVGLSRGVDPRKGGSGNIGATNVARVLGHKKYFWIVFFLDLFKSLVPMAVASAIVLHVPHEDRDWHMYLLWLLVGFAAVIGHMFSIFLGFKGGKGVATSAGVMLGLFPYYTGPGLIAIAIFLIVFLIWRYISLGSMIGASAFPIAYLIIGLLRRWPVFGDQLPLLIFAILMPVLIVYKHRGNIARLRAGTESRFEFKRAEPATPASS
jgi:glycerol-3-phosphate acyltransferase PlsY